jgi:DNA-binding MarR family transcriptional regulator
LWTVPTETATQPPPVGPPAPRRSNPGFDLLADELLAAMGAIRRTGRRRAGRPEELSGLTGSQLELVRLLRRRPGLSVSQVADELHLAPNTVSTLVRQLVDLGYVVRRCQTADRRVARLDLAEDLGRKVVAFRDRRMALIVDAMHELPVADQRRLRSTVGVLLKLQRAMERGGTRD